MGRLKPLIKAITFGIDFRFPVASFVSWHIDFCGRFTRCGHLAYFGETFCEQSRTIWISLCLECEADILCDEVVEDRRVFLPWVVFYQSMWTYRNAQELLTQNAFWGNVYVKTPPNFGSKLGLPRASVFCACPQIWKRKSLQWERIVMRQFQWAGTTSQKKRLQIFQLEFNFPVALQSKSWRAQKDFPNDRQVVSFNVSSKHLRSSQKWTQQQNDKGSWLLNLVVWNPRIAKSYFQLTTTLKRPAMQFLKVDYFSLWKYCDQKEEQKSLCVQLRYSRTRFSTD